MSVNRRIKFTACRRLSYHTLTLQVGMFVDRGELLDVRLSAMDSQLLMMLFLRIRLSNKLIADRYFIRPAYIYIYIYMYRHAVRFSSNRCKKKALFAAIYIR